VTSRKLSAFIDSLVSNRRPGRYWAGAEDAEVLRMAISMRAGRPGDAMPDEQFVSGLYQQLAEQTSPRSEPGVRPARMQRARAAVATVAASLVLLAGTATVTDLLVSSGATPTAVPLPHGQLMRTATFEAADGQPLGQIVAYGGHPSWVFMDIRAAAYDGRVTCMLRSHSGSVVAVGAFVLRDGSGQFSRTVPVNAGQIRGARLVTADGTIMASASFA
jgi:hypothetical protein